MAIIRLLWSSSLALKTFPYHSRRILFLDSSSSEDKPCRLLSAQTFHIILHWHITQNGLLMLQIAPPLQLVNMRFLFYPNALSSFNFLGFLFIFIVLIYICLFPYLKKNVGGGGHSHGYISLDCIIWMDISLF